MSNPERYLWRAVIDQALADAALPMNNADNIRAREDARRWLKPCKDFATVCDYADLPMSGVLKLVPA